jgi:hypothetical protein
MSLIFFSYDSNLFFVDLLQSSLAAARADNFYYPPEWSPKKVPKPGSIVL